MVGQKVLLGGLGRTPGPDASAQPSPMMSLGGSWSCHEKEFKDRPDTTVERCK